jgi:hypothetical protein
MSFQESCLIGSQNKPRCPGSKAVLSLGDQNSELGGRRKEGRKERRDREGGEMPYNIKK